MRRVALVLCLLMASCTQTAPEAPERLASASPTQPPPTTVEPSVTPTPAETLVDDDCGGLDRVAAVGEITLIEDSKVRAFRSLGGSGRCLIDLAGREDLFDGQSAPSWSPSGRRVIIDDRAISADGVVTDPLTDVGRETPIWSRPTGTSVVYITSDGRLEKRSSFGGEALDISFLARHDDVTYHPAGTHIATTGLHGSGRYGLWLATNIGTEPKLIARGEEAKFITNLEFAHDGSILYYTARHGAQNWHFHRLFIGASASLETIVKQRNDFEYAVSPFNGYYYAWFVPGDCAAGEPGTFRSWLPKDRRLKLTPEMQNSDVHPIGWLRNGKLVVRVAPISCSATAAGDVYVLSNEEPVLIDEENDGNVSVRVRLPLPPPPPGEEQEVVA